MSIVKYIYIYIKNISYYFLINLFIVKLISSKDLLLFIYFLVHLILCFGLYKEIILQFFFF